MSPMDSLITYARSFLGTPYLYGGNNRLTGIDCSGFVLEILRKCSLIASCEDLSAQGIYDKFSKTGMNIPLATSKLFPIGSLIFYGKSTSKITHIAFAIDNFSVIECGGGNEKTVSFEVAKILGACVRERGYKLRTDIIAVVFPKYPFNEN